MIMELSKLMRNVHYEGIPRTPLFRETDFVASYVELMRKRYPNRKVHISLELPEGNRKRVSLPPAVDQHHRERLQAWHKRPESLFRGDTALK